ncbi:hypothetical protein CDD83_5657 [Cordyceps sp. RAO-2017]|nr:hypothetical protein CDD83_5657 [Cordyceps sp. RAO-2017]
MVAETQALDVRRKLASVEKGSQEQQEGVRTAESGFDDVDAGKDTRLGQLSEMATDETDNSEMLNRDHVKNAGMYVDRVSHQRHGRYASTASHRSSADHDADDERQRRIADAGPKIEQGWGGRPEYWPWHIRVAPARGFRSSSRDHNTTVLALRFSGAGSHTGKCLPGP